MDENYILQFIPTGVRNAIRRNFLVALAGMKDREVRELIHKARRKIPILNLSTGRGYFIPDMNEKEDIDALIKWVRQEESRLNSIKKNLKTAKRTLKNCGIDWRSKNAA